MAPVLRPSRCASVVAVAGPSPRRRVSIRSRTGWLRARSPAMSGVMEEGMSSGYDGKELFANTSLQ